VIICATILFVILFPQYGCTQKLELIVTTEEEGVQLIDTNKKLTGHDYLCLKSRELDAMKWLIDDI